ncbi:MAG: Zn-dependent hydrolase [Desulfobacterales bacterium]|jgi:allantoate deiminase
MDTPFTQNQDRLKINGKRLWSNLMELGRIGRQANSGVTRTALSDADQQARQWLIDKMTSAGLAVDVDAVMNVIGTLKADSPRTHKKAVMGSHLDTVPNGGMFDGALGVLAALECALTFQENRVQLPWDLEVISFCDEEAAHNAGTVGSRAMMGLLQTGEIDRTKTRGAPTFARNLERWDRDPRRIDAARRNPDDLAFFLELHIEQGRRLEAENLRIGAVTAIVGIYRYIVSVAGEPAHAGTTPMSLRKDALVEAAPVFTLLPEWLRQRNPEMVGTIGQVNLEPGASNVVPGECRFVVELRSQDNADMQAVRETLNTYASQREGWRIETIYEKNSVRLAEPLMDHIIAAAESEGLSWCRMPSGAGHDAQSLAPFVPTGMIFVPCRNGVSHAPAEWIEADNAAEGCQVLCKTVLQLAAEYRKTHAIPGN